MLVVMSYSAGLFIAVILGQGLGNLVFFHKDSSLIIPPKACQESLNVNCHTPSGETINSEYESFSENVEEPLQNVITVDVHHQTN